MNAPIETFFGWLLRASWQAAALAILVLAAQVIFRKRWSARWRYALWLLVVARLALPVFPPSPMSIFNYARLDRLAGKTLARLAEPSPPFPAQNPSQPGGAAVLRSPDPSHSVSAPTIAASPPPPPAPKPVSIYDNLNWPATGATLWLAGVLFLIARLARQNAVFLRQLRQAREISDAPTAALLVECRRLLGVSAPVRLAETEHIRSPALYGLFAPRMLLPAGLSREFTRPELRHVFLHELAHLKRHDMPVHCVTGFLHILNWFNPVLWFAFRRMAADRELACDELALSCAGEGEKRAYGETIIKLLEQCSRPAALPGLMGILEDKTQMRRRILMIAGFKPVRRWSPLAVAILVALSLVALTDAQVNNSNTPSILPKPGLGLATNNTPSNPPLTTVTGTVLLPDGQPAAGAQVALDISANPQPRLSHAKLIWDWRPGINLNTLPREADQAGRFSFPYPFDAVAIVAVHEQGYARVGRQEFENASRIVLRPWGRIEGVLRLGTGLGTNQQVLLTSSNVSWFALDFQASQQMTDRDGKFVFSYVPPGVWHVEPSGSQHADADWFTVKAGETNHVTLGRTGRPVIGKLLISTATNASYDYYTAALYSPGLELYARHQLKDGTGKWVMDGAFRVEDVSAGTWWFLAEFVRSNKFIATLGRTVVVPDMQGGRSDEPLDLGTMETSLVHTPQVGEAAPLFEVQTTNFGAFRLSDHRGQYVLLDFEDDGDSLNTELVSSVWASFGTNRRLAMLTVWLPQPGFISVGGDNTEYRWPVARLLDRLDSLPWYERMALCGDYGLPINRNDPAETNLPCLMLVGPDGKIVGSDLRGDAIKAAVAAALEKK